MFSAILGLAGSAIGAMASLGAAGSAATASMYQTQAYEREALRNHDLQQMNIGISRDQLRMMMDENQYTRQLEQENRLALLNEQLWARSEYGKYKSQLKEEQNYMLDRQMRADKAAAQQRALAIQEYLKNRALAKEEREAALADLEHLRAIAKGERDDDMRRYYQAQQQKQAERNFMMAQYGNMDERQKQERAYELQRRGMIEGRINDLSSSLERARQQMGDVPDFERYSKADIAAEESRRADIARADVDRAATRVASVNEAELMRNGMDISGTADRKRGDITRQIADLYEKARLSARDDALAYITGAQGMFRQNFEADLARRDFMMKEIGNTKGAGIDLLMQLPQLPSAVNNGYEAIPSGIYEREIASALNYRPDMAIGSAIYDNLNVPVGMANTMSIPSAAQTGWQGMPSAIMGPYAQQFANPQGFMSIAAQIGSDIMQSRGQMAMAAQDRADAAYSAAGRSFQNLISSIGGFASQMPSLSQRAPSFQPTLFNGSASNQPGISTSAFYGTQPGLSAPGWSNPYPVNTNTEWGGWR